LPIGGKVHELAEGCVLVFYVPEAPRQHKPVYLDGNPKTAYIRRGGRDDTCTGDELLHLNELHFKLPTHRKRRFVHCLRFINRVF